MAATLTSTSPTGSARERMTVFVMSLRWPAARRGQATQSAPAGIDPAGEFTDLPADLVRAGEEGEDDVGAPVGTGSGDLACGSASAQLVRRIMQVDPLPGLEAELGRLRAARVPRRRHRMPAGADGFAVAGTSIPWTGLMDIMGEEHGMFADTKAFSGFAVNDLEAAEKFYAQTLGLRTSEQYGLLGLHLRRQGHAGLPETGSRARDVHDPQLRCRRHRRGRRRTGQPRRADGKVRRSGTGREGHQPGRADDIAWFKDLAGNILAVLQER